jgi:hypothetical protein
MPTIVDEDLPADEPIGTLEPVAYFNGAMPTRGDYIAERTHLH